MGVSPGGGASGDASRLNRAALRPSALRFGRNTPGIPPSRALSAGRLAALGAHATFSTGCWDPTRESPPGPIPVRPWKEPWPESIRYTVRSVIPVDSVVSVGPNMSALHEGSAPRSPEILVPTAYRNGFEMARWTDPELSHRYIEHTVKGDPLADAAVESMAGMPQKGIHELITAGMDGDEAGFRGAPAELRELIEFSCIQPDWFDSRAVYPGCRAFHADSDLYVQALVGSSIVWGFTTLISKSFFMTGRLTDHGVRRLRQNIRQLIEIMMPGGLERYAEGWKLSVRIRLIHAQVRYFLRRSDEWEEAEFGVPIHIAHVALAAANFSARVIEAAKRLGAEPTEEESEAFVQIWRYSAHLMGVPETILFTSEAEALALCRIAVACEPRPTIEGIVMANALVNSAPVVIGVRKPAERQQLANYVYRVSRALIGDQLADQINYPAQSTRGLLFYLRTRRRLAKRLRKLVPRWEAKVKVDRFTALVDNSQLRDPLISYRLPPKLHSDETQTW